MKKIFTLITLLIASNVIYSQNITSATAAAISCNGDLTDIVVTTDASALQLPLSYNLYLYSGSTPFPYPGYPQNSATANFTIFNLNAANYLVEIIDVTGTPVSNQIVSIPAITPFDYSSLFPTTINNISCNGADDGDITIYLQGGTPNYDFTWSGPGGYSATTNGYPSSSISNLAPGTYTCIATDDNGCIFQGTPVIISGLITQPSVLDVSNTSISAFSGGFGVSCFGSNDGTATLTPSGGTGPYDFNWSGPGGYSSTLNNASSSTVNGLLAGDYTCTVTDNNDCVETTAVLTLTQPLAFSTTVSLSINNGFTISCNGGNDGTATAVPLNGVGTIDYVWADAAGIQFATSAAIAALTAGDYSCTVEDDNGCSYTELFTVTEPSSLVLPTAVVTSNWNGEDISCFGASNGEATASALLASGTPYSSGSPYMYLWSDGQSTAVASGLAAGNYNCEVIDANNCSAFAFVTLTQPPAINILSTSSTEPLCTGDFNGTATVNPDGGTGSFSYNWDDISNQQTQTATGLNAANYECIVTDDNGCSYSSNPIVVTVTDPPLLSLSISNIDNVSCTGGSDGQATVGVVGGTPDFAGNYLYSWSTGQITPNASGFSETTTSGIPYTCIVTDDNGCNDVIGVYITEPVTLPSAITTSTMVSCKDGTDGEATIVASGGTPGYAYVWKDDLNVIIDITSNPTGLTAGTYECTVTDDKGCPVVVTEQVLEPSTNITLNPTSITNVSCNGGSNGIAIVFPTGGVPGYSYSWTGPAPSTTVISNTNQIASVVEGTYICAITDSEGCVYTETVNITAPAVIGFTLPVQYTDPSCPLFNDGQATVIPTGGTGVFTYLWDDPLAQTTATATNLAAGTFTCVVTDDNNCSPASAIISVTLTDPSTITILPSPTPVLCTGDATGSITLAVSGGTQDVFPATPYQYLWSNSTTTNNNSSLVAGNYTCIITDANGCVASTGAINISEPATAISATIINIVDESCFGSNDGSATANPIGGTLPYASYAWSNASSGNVANGLLGGIYTCDITDANGCLVTAGPITINSATALNITSTVQSPTCNSTTIGISNDGTATVSVAGGTGVYFYQWDDALFQTSATASNLIAGTYNCNIVDDNTCVISETVIVPEPSPNLNATFTTTNNDCFGGANGSITINAIGGTAPFVYEWVQTGQTTATINGLIAGTYECNIYDATGSTCVTVFSTAITQNSLLTFTSIVNPMSVNGANDGSMSVAASGGTGPGTYTYIWTDITGLTIGTTASINSLAAGSYTCTITDGAGCTATFTDNINDPGCTLIVTDNISTIDCYGDLANVFWTNTGGLPPYTNQLTAPDGTDLSLAWSTNQFNTNSSAPLQLGVGNHILTVTDASGLCFDNINLNIVEPAELEFLTLTTTDVNCNGGSDGTAAVTTTGGTTPVLISWSYQFSALPPINENALAVGNYLVTATDGNGCYIDSVFTISEPAAPLTVTTSSTDVGCFPTNNGTATALPTGGTAPYYYDWSGIVTQTLSNLVAGTYACTVTDDNGCTLPVTQVVSDAPNLNLLITQIDPLCDGSTDGSITSTFLAGTNPVVYSWIAQNDPLTVFSSNSAVNPLASGSYTLTAVDANGCNYSSPTITLTDPSPITYILNPSPTTLNGASDGSITVTGISGGVGPYSYQWIGAAYNSTPLAPGDITALEAGTYTLTVTDGNLCTGVQAANILEPACNITSNFSVTQPACFGDVGGVTFFNTGGAAPYLTEIKEYGTNLVFYSAYNNPPTSPISLPDGDYYMIVTDNYSCQSPVYDITITEPLPLVATVSVTQPICNGDFNGQAIANVSGGSTVVNYNWSNNLSNNTPINSGLNAQAATTLQVIDIYGCMSALVNYTITDPAALIITSFSHIEPNCNGSSDGTAMATVIGGTGTLTYAWAPSGETTNPANNLLAGTETLIVTDANGCTATDNVNIGQPLPLNITFSSVNNASCFGFTDGSITIDVTSLGGTPPYYYSWDDPAGSTTPFVSGLAAGTYSCTVTDANTCTNTFSQTITEPASLVSNLIISDANCNGALGLATVSPAGGSGGTYSIQWFDLSTLGTNSLLTPAIGFYWVTITDDNTGCSIIEYFDILEPDPITATSTTSPTTCNGGADGQMIITAIGGTAPYTFDLYDATGLVDANNTGIFLNLEAGTYTCDITDGFCTTVVQETNSVLEPNPIVLNPTITLITCFGGNDGIATVSPTGENDNFTISWSNLLPPGPTATGLSGLQTT